MFKPIKCLLLISLSYIFLGDVNANDRDENDYQQAAYVADSRATNVEHFPHGFVGLKGGWHRGKDDLYNYSNPDNAFWGIYGGIQLAPRLSWDLGYQVHRKLKASATNVEVETSLIESALAYHYPITQRFDIYGRAGVAFWDMDKSSDVIMGGDTGLSPLWEAGLRFRINDATRFSIGYQHISRIGTGDATLGSIGRYNSDTFVASVSYRFGHQPRPPAFRETIIREVQATPPKQKMQEYTITAEALFDFDSDVIKEPALLDELIAMLQQSTGVIKVIGHTDNVGSDNYNQDLSERRAIAVSTYFQEHGIASSRISTQGMAARSPVATNSTAAGRAQNRRVNVLFETNVEAE